jgi:hypothetical protein
MSDEADEVGYEGRDLEFNQQLARITRKWSKADFNHIIDDIKHFDDINWALSIDKLRDGTAKIFRITYLFFAKILVGYGYYPARSLYTAIVVVIIGALVFRSTKEARDYSMPIGLAYSFDMLLPIVHLRELHYKIELNTPRARYYFYVHKLIGYALGLFLIASLNGWVK